MVHSSASRQCAARGSDSADAAGAGRAAHGPAGRRPTDSIKIQQLEALRHRLEELILDCRYRAPQTVSAFERTVEEAESIGAGIRAVFRGGPLPQEHPPLEFRTDGNGHSHGWW